MEQSATYFFALVNGDNRRSPIGVPQEQMTAFLSDPYETNSFESFDDLMSGERFKPHALDFDLLDAHEAERHRNFFIDF